MSDILQFRQDVCVGCGEPLRCSFRLTAVFQNGQLTIMDNDEALRALPSWYCPNGCDSPMPAKRLKGVVVNAVKQLPAALLDYSRLLTGHPPGSRDV